MFCVLFLRQVIPAVPRIIVIDVTVMATLYSISSQSIPKKHDRRGEKRHRTKRKLEKILDSRKKCVTFLVVWSEQPPHPGLGRGPEDQEEPHDWLTPWGSRGKCASRRKWRSLKFKQICVRSNFVFSEYVENVSYPTTLLKARLNYNRFSWILTYIHQ